MVDVADYGGRRLFSDDDSRSSRPGAYYGGAAEYSREEAARRRRRRELSKGPPSTPAAPGPASDDDDSGVLGNLWEDVKSLKNIPRGVGNIFLSSARDIATVKENWDNATENPGLESFKKMIDHNEYESDELAKAIVNDYVHTYGPALTGDPGTTVDRIKEHPLGPILDIAAVISGGATLAAKGGMKASATAARAGAMTKAAERIAGVKRVPKTEENLRLADDITAQTGRKATETKTGELLIPKTGRIKRGTEEILTARSITPTRRLRQASFDYVSNRFPEARLGIGASQRYGRLKSRRLEREKVNLDGVTSAEYRAFRKTKDGKKFLKSDRMKTYLNDISAHDVDITSRISQLLTEKAGLALTKEQRDILSKESGILDKSITKEMVDSDDDFDEILIAAAERSDELGASPETVDAILNARNTDQLIDVATRPLQKLKAHRDKDIISAAIDKRVSILNDILETPLSQEERSIIAAAKKLEEGVSERTTSIIKEAGGKPRETRPFLAQEVLGILRANESKPFIVPHKAALQGTSKQRRELKKRRGEEPATPGSFKYNSQYNYRYGINKVNLESVLEAYFDATAYMTKKKKIDTLLDTAKTMGPLEKIPKGWTMLGGEKMQSGAAKIARWLDEDAELVFGADNPHLESLKETVKNTIAKTSGRDVKIVPSRVYDELLSDMEASSALVKKWVDKPTAVWRAIVLNMRPSWLVGNIIGQFALLMATHGIFSSLKHLADARGAKGKLVDELAPSLRAESQGIVEAERTASLVGAGAKNFRRIVNFMGKLNAVLSDDYPRRAAFLADIKPHVKTLQKEKGLNWENAAREYLSNPKVLDRHIEGVLGDLVDFRNMSRFERSVVRRFAPFYSWIKGSTKKAGIDLLGGQETGTAYRRAVRMTSMPRRERYGRVLGALQGPEEESAPEFLRGSLMFKAPEGLGPLYAMFDIDEGDNTVMRVGSFDPYQTPIGLLEMGKALMSDEEMSGSENPLSAMNPFLKAPIESLTRKNIFTGQELEGTPLGILAKQTLLSTPQTAALARIKQAKSMSSADRSRKLFEPSAKREAWRQVIGGLTPEEYNPSTGRFIKDMESGRLKQVKYYTTQ